MEIPILEPTVINERKNKKLELPKLYAVWTKGKYIVRQTNIDGSYLNVQADILT